MPQCYAGSMFLATSWTNFVMSNMSIYLVFVVRLEPFELGSMMVALLVVIMAARIAALPLFARLLLRHPHTCHPAR